MEELRPVKVEKFFSNLNYDLDLIEPEEIGSK